MPWFSRTPTKPRPAHEPHSTLTTQPDPSGRVQSADFHHQRKNHMQQLTIEQTAVILQAASIEHTTDHGHAIVHTGTTDTGQRFVLINDHTGTSVVSYPL